MADIKDTSAGARESAHILTVGAAPRTLPPPPASLTCAKLFRDIPFAHRQPAHAGHCRRLHGHNWAFQFTFAAHALDACGFILDFGGRAMHAVRDLVREFDHALVLEEGDPEINRFDGFIAAGLAHVLTVPSASCEGLALHLCETASTIVEAETQGRVWVAAVLVEESGANSATCYRTWPVPAWQSDDEGEQ